MRLKYIRKVAEAYPYDYEEPPICKVGLWDFSRANENDEARKEAVCLVASISYGNEYCKDPERLWNLLIERGHESPMEFIVFAGSNLRNVSIPTFKETGYRDLPKGIKQSYATLKLKVPIFVARQIQRHRAFSYMEMSRRYVKGDKVEFEIWNLPTNQLPWVRKLARQLCQLGYNEVLKQGAKPEQARSFLPLGLYTQFWMQGDYKAWLNFFIHRLHPEAQEETRLVAQAMWNLLREHQPEIVKTMADYIEEWAKDCNPMFTPAREKRAEWFKENFLKEEG